MSKWIGRIFGERIPGTDQTYGQRLGAVTNEMKTAFKNDWSDEKYQEFEAWGVNPSEIENVPGGPQDEWENLLSERARDLGVEIPVDAAE